MSKSRRRPAAASQASEESSALLERTKAIVDTLTGVGLERCFVWHLRDHRMLAGEEELADLYGWKREEINAMPGGWNDLVHPEDQELGQEMVLQLMKSRRYEVVEARMRIRCKNGKWEVVHVRQRVLDRDEKGVPVTMAGISRIITHLVEPYENFARQTAVTRLMVDHAADAIMLCDARGAVLYGNGAAERMLGYKRHGLRGHSLWQLFDVPRKAVPRDLSTLKRSHSPRAQCDAQRKDFKKGVTVDLRLRRIGDNEFLCIARDISVDMKRAEEARLQAAYYRGLFANNTSGVLVLNEAMRISAVNKAFATLVKTPASKIIGKPLTSFLADDSLEDAKRMLFDMQRNVKFNTAYARGMQLTLKNQKGGKVLTRVSLTAMGDQTVLFRQGIVIFTDITEETRVRQQLDEKAEFNKVLLSSASAAIIVSDPEGRIMDVNPAVEKLTGFSRRQLLGKFGWASGLLDPEQAEGTQQRFQELQAGAQVVNSTLRIYTKAGGIRIVETQSTAARRPNGELACIIIIGMDVTEQKRLEAEAIKFAEQEQMRIGHDLHDGVGQTLTGIMSLTEALEAQLEGELQTEAGRIRELVRDAVIQVRQLSHGLSPAAVKHRGLAASLRLLAERMSSQRLRCECHITWEPHFRDPEAETHLFRVAQEAVANAVKHGRPRVLTISLRAESGNAGLMEIEDDGVGISSSQTGSKEGIGIRVMRYRINLLGGVFTIAPRSGGGTKVSCRFACAL